MATSYASLILREKSAIRHYNKNKNDMNFTLSNISDKLIGLLIMGVNIYWLMMSFSLFYRYHFTDVQFIFMIPSWVLIFNSFLAFLGVGIAVMIIMSRVKLLKWGAIDFGLVLAGTLLQITIIS